MRLTDVPAFEMPSHETSRYLETVQSAVDEIKRLILDLAVCDMGHGQKRRALRDARQMLAELKSAADRVRRSTGAA